MHSLLELPVGVGGDLVFSFASMRCLSGGGSVAIDRALMTHGREASKPDGVQARGARCL